MVRYGRIFAMTTGHGRLTGDETDVGKRTKESVNYRDAAGKKRCGNCRYSYGPKSDRHCMKVKGQIQPTMLCDLWKPEVVNP
jgi:hypothetical protein